MNRSRPTSLHRQHALCRVTLTHEYFGGPFAGYTISPFPSTAAICQRAGLSLQREADGLLLTFDRTRQSALRPAALAALAESSLCWQLTPGDPEFAAVTEPSWAQTDCLVLTPNGPAADDRLTVGVAASEADLWPRRPLCFDCTVTKSLKAAYPVMLESDLGVPLLPLAPSNARRVRVDTRRFGPGMYRLTQGERVIARWFGDERASATAPAVAILVLPGGLIAGCIGTAAGEASEREPRELSAAFTARAAVWRYHIFIADAGDDLRIEPASLGSDDDSAGRGRGRAAFKPLPAGTIAGAHSFESRTAFRLRRRPPERFVLRGRAMPRDVPLPLPAAGAPPSDYADIFVHL